MKVITAKAHGIIDYAVVLFLLTAPGLFNFSGVVLVLTYSVAVIHFLLTVTTNFQWGLFRILSFKIHGWVELIASIMLATAPWLLGFNESSDALMFYSFFGLAVFIVWLLTDYCDW